MHDQYKVVYETIGENIKHFREVKGLTQQQLADRCPGLGRTKISRMENGIINFVISTLLQICEALGVTLAEISTKRKEENKEE